MLRKAGEALEFLRGLGEAAVLSDVVRGRQVRRGQLTYSNVPELYASAVDYLKASKLPVTPANVRKAASELISRQEDQLDELVGIFYDENGVKIPDELDKESAPGGHPGGARVAYDPSADPYGDTPF